MDNSLSRSKASVKVELVSKNEAMTLWLTEVTRFKETGFWPLLVDPKHAFHLRDGENTGDSDSAEEILSLSASINPSELRTRLMSENQLDEDEIYDAAAYLSARETKPKLLNQSISGLTVPHVLSDQSVGLALIKTATPYEVFAQVAFGGWNSVPADEELIALFRDYYMRFGAVPVSVSSDTIELWVTRPIEEPEVACLVAQELYSFCPDIVEQGTETVQALAQSLLNARVWFFWWD